MNQLELRLLVLEKKMGEQENIISTLIQNLAQSNEQINAMFQRIATLENKTVSSSTRMKSAKTGK